MRAARETSSMQRRQHRPTPFNGCDLFTADQWQAIGRFLALSSREFQIVQCMFADCAQEQIARKLMLSSHTVHTYIERLYRKLGVSSRPALLLRVFAAYLSTRRVADASPT